MKKIEASKLSRGLSKVLAEIEGGARYEITRYGKVIAKLVPPGAREPKAEPTLATATPALDQSKSSPSTDEIRAKRRAFLYDRIKNVTPTDPKLDDRADPAQEVPGL